MDLRPWMNATNNGQPLAHNSNVALLVDRLNTRLMAGQLPTAARTIIENYVKSLGYTTPTNGELRTRVRAAMRRTRRRSAPVLAMPRAAKVTDTSAVGAAMLTTVAVGAYPDVAAAASRGGEVADVMEPDPALRGVYDEAHGRYRLLFDSLKPMFAGMG